MNQYSETTDPSRALAPPRLRVGIVVNVVRDGAWLEEVVTAVGLRPELDLVDLVAVTGSAQAGTHGTGSTSFARLPDLIDRWIAQLRDYGKPVVRLDPWPTTHPRPANVTAHRVTPREIDAAEFKRRVNGFDVLLDLTSKGIAGATGWSSASRDGDLAAAASPAVPPTVLYAVTSTGARLADEQFGLMEVLRDTPSTRVFVVAQSADMQRPIVIRDGVYITFRYSWTEHRRRLQAKATLLLLDRLAELAAGARLGRASALANVAPPLTVPVRASLADCLRLICRGIARFLRNRLQPPEWDLLFVSGRLARASPASLCEARAPPGHFWADPFLVTWRGETRVFFEDFDAAQGRAVIATATCRDGHLDDVRTAIAPDQHVSYPFPLQHGGVLYMLPEASQSKALTLWRCDDFPDRWLPHRKLLDNISVADATLLLHGGRWWMLANVDRVGLNEHSDELHLFHADDPVAGPWRPHAANPVLTDARHARMGGDVLHGADGQLLRPAQVGGDVYGAGLNLRQIVRLDLEGYAEQAAGGEPSWIERHERVHHCHQGETLGVLDVGREPTGLAGLLHAMLDRKT